MKYCYYGMVELSFSSLKPFRRHAGVINPNHVYANHNLCIGVSKATRYNIETRNAERISVAKA